MEKFSIFLLLCIWVSFSNLFIVFIIPIFLDSPELEYKWASSHDARPSRQEVSADNALENRALTGGLSSNDHDLGQLDRVLSVDDIECILELHHQWNEFFNLRHLCGYLY